MSENLQKAKKVLEDGKYSCVLVKAADGFTSDKRGITPIIDCLRTQPGLMKGAAAADKVIGKAAAMLLVYGGVKEIHAEIISSHAAEFLKLKGIEYTSDEYVEYITNRDNTGMCPMEKRALELTDEKIAFKIFNSILSNN